MPTEEQKYKSNTASSIFNKDETKKTIHLLLIKEIAICLDTKAKSNQLAPINNGTPPILKPNESP